VEPVSGEEGLVTADIHLDRVLGERQNFDPAGHYFRGDVIEVRVDRARRAPASFSE
jgi:nitrilase